MPCSRIRRYRAPARRIHAPLGRICRRSSCRHVPPLDLRGREGEGWIHDEQRKSRGIPPHPPCATMVERGRSSKPTTTWIWPGSGQLNLPAATAGRGRGRRHATCHHALRERGRRGRYATSRRAPRAREIEAEEAHHRPP
jgi:hypothetical protein